MRDIDAMVAAIRSLSVRGAPAIGVMAAMGLASLASGAALSLLDSKAFLAQISAWSDALRGARPTAVNLAWAVDRVVSVAVAHSDPVAAAAAMRAESDAIRDADREMCRRIGEFGAELIDDGMTILTHCNTGVLATAGIGTALAIMYVAHERGLQINVLASETRPLLQGSRLTAWELSRAGIPVTVVTEAAVASLMRAGMVDVCIVGADRIASNGDVANKIGTFSHAVLASAHAIPFYVAAPQSTVDTETASGDDIQIEERSASELLRLAGHSDERPGVSAYNPAFDVTPAALISAIITDSGVHRAPYRF